MRKRFEQAENTSNETFVGLRVQRIVLTKTSVLLSLKAGAAEGKIIELARLPASARARIETQNCQPHREPNVSMVHALARAHLWRNALCAGTYQSIEAIAAAVKWHPKVVRKVLRLAFLAPDITEAIMLGTQPPRLCLTKLQKVESFCWDTQRSALGFSARNVAAV